MRGSVCLVAALLFVESCASTWAQDKAPQPPKKIADGVYAVLREGPKEKDVLPLKDGEALIVDRHPYLKKDDEEPPRVQVVHAAPDVKLDLAGKPKADKDGEEVVRILLKLQSEAAKDLEHLTSERVGKQITIVVGGEVVTTHKIRAAIKDGEIQITCCAPGSAKHLLEQLLAHYEKK
jgi:preprotein translocase subunit SecD